MLVIAGIVAMFALVLGLPVAAGISQVAKPACEDTVHNSCK